MFVFVIVVVFVEFVVFCNECLWIEVVDVCDIE